MVMNSIARNNRKDTDLHKIAILIGALCKAPQDAFPQGYERKITYDTIKNLPPLNLKIISAGTIPSIQTIRMYLLVEAGLGHLCNQDELQFILNNSKEKKSILEGQSSIVEAHDEWARIGASHGGGKKEKEEVDEEAIKKAMQKLFDETREEIVKKIEREKSEYQQQLDDLVKKKEAKIAAERLTLEAPIDKQIQEKQNDLATEKSKDVSNKSKIETINSQIAQLNSQLEAKKVELQVFENEKNGELAATQKALADINEQLDSLRSTLAGMDLATLSKELKRYQP
jgi:hypothetical protein